MAVIEPEKALEGALGKARHKAAATRAYCHFDSAATSCGGVARSVTFTNSAVLMAVCALVGR
jgi:hypothetical protein